MLLWLINLFLFGNTIDSACTTISDIAFLLKKIWPLPYQLFCLSFALNLWLCVNLPVSRNNFIFCTSLKPPYNLPLNTLQYFTASWRLISASLVSTYILRLILNVMCYLVQNSNSNPHCQLNWGWFSPNPKVPSFLFVSLAFHQYHPSGSPLKKKEWCDYHNAYIH